MCFSPKSWTFCPRSSYFWCPCGYESHCLHKMEICKRVLCLPYVLRSVHITTENNKAHEQSTSRLQLVLHSKSIQQLCWTLGMVKNTYFSFCLYSPAPHPRVLILLTFHLFFYCLARENNENFYALSTDNEAEKRMLRIWDKSWSHPLILTQFQPRGLLSGVGGCGGKESLISVEKTNFYYKWKLEIERSQFHSFIWYFSLFRRAISGSGICGIHSGVDSEA